jgi:hypothetical protein
MVRGCVRSLNIPFFSAFYSGWFENNFKYSILREITLAFYAAFDLFMYI